MRKFILFVATGAGTGYLPVAPGTWGSALGLLLFWPLAGLPAAWTLLALAGLTVLGTWAAGHAETLLGSHDDARITIDEVAGVWLALVLLPARLEVLVAGFALFRLFDIWKPPPVRQAERLTLRALTPRALTPRPDGTAVARGGGVAVMADDLVAGLYANVCGQILWRVLLPGGLT